MKSIILLSIMGLVGLTGCSSTAEKIAAVQKKSGPSVEEQKRTAQQSFREMDRLAK